MLSTKMELGKGRAQLALSIKRKAVVILNLNEENVMNLSGKNRIFFVSNFITSNDSIESY